MGTDNYIVLKRYETPLHEKMAKILCLSNESITETKWDSVRQTFMNRDTANCAVKILNFRKAANNRVVELSKEEVQRRIDIVIDRFIDAKIENMVCMRYKINTNNRAGLYKFRGYMRAFIWMVALLKDNDWHGENPDIDELVNMIESVIKNSAGSYEKYTYRKYN